MSLIQDLIDQKKWDHYGAIIERYTILAVLPLLIVSQIVFFVIPAYIPLSSSIVDEGRTGLWIGVVLVFCLVGRRSLFHLSEALAKRHWKRILLFGLGAMPYIVFSCLGSLDASNRSQGLPPIFVMPQWALPIWFLVTDGAAVFLWKWYASKEAIRHDLPLVVPTPPITIELPIEEWKHVHKEVENAQHLFVQFKSEAAKQHELLRNEADHNYELLRQENLSLQKQLDGYKLIVTPPKNVNALLKRNICLMCQKGQIVNKTHSVCASCRSRYCNVINQIDRQRFRARSKGLPATLTLYQWLEKLDYYGRCCSCCQRNPAQVIEHFIPVSKGGGTTAENCDPACQQCNREKSAIHPERMH